MRPGDGPRANLESKLPAIAQANQSHSLAKAVLSAGRLAEKMGWMPTTVRASDWNLVMAIELHRSKEERAAAKEWAQIDDLIRICEAAKSPTDWEAVALACLSVPRCLRRSEAGGPLRQGRGGGRTEQSRGGGGGGAEPRAGALGARVVATPGQAQGPPRVPPRQGTWHGSGEALGKTLVSLLERVGGEDDPVACVPEVGGGPTQTHGCPHANHHALGGWKTLGVAKMYTEAPPRWKFVRSGEIPWPLWGGTGGREPRYKIKKGSTLALWPFWVRTEIVYAQGEGPRRPRGRDATAQGADRTRGCTASPAPRGGGGGGDHWRQKCPPREV